MALNAVAVVLELPVVALLPVTETLNWKLAVPVKPVVVVFPIQTELPCRAEPEPF